MTRMNWRAIRALARRDLLVVRRSRALMVPLVLVPVVLLVLVPLGLALGPIVAARYDPAGAAELAQMLRTMSAGAHISLADAEPAEIWLRLLNAQLLPPLFLLVPFLVAQVIAADSFAGERERRTLEALLYTPLTDGELLTAKLLAALVPAIVVDVLGFVLNAAVMAAGSAMLIGKPLLPDLTWLVLVAWVAPAFAAAGLAGMILISLRTRSAQEAIQLGGLLVLPLIGLIISMARGAIVFGPGVLLIVGAAIWVLGAALLLVGRAAFRRTRIVTRL